MADTEPEVAADAPPKFFKTLNGWIVGATGSVLAFAGLWAAVDTISSRFKSAKIDAPVTVKSQTPVAPPAAAVAPEATAPQEAVPAEAEASSYPDAYTGSGLRIEWNGDRWIESKDGQVTGFYLDGGQDAEFTVIIEANSNIEWRWPTNGGPVEVRPRRSAAWGPSDYNYQPD